MTENSQAQMMDVAADIAKEELNDLPDKVVFPVAEWWQKHYLKAGHKRLGRVLLGIWREREKIKSGG